ncbi:hypothetical protein [Salibacterium sp. K-3]
MELYTWPEDRVMVRLHKDDQLFHGWRIFDEWSVEESEVMFAVLFQIICDHFNMREDIQIQAEISRPCDDMLFFVIECLDEEGEKLSIRNPDIGSTELLFRFGAKEHLVSFAEQAKVHALKGGTLIFFYPFCYMLFETSAVSDDLAMFMEEYGERSNLDASYIRRKGTVIQEKDALQFLAAGHRWNI